MDKIIIFQLQTEAVIGVYEQERQKPQLLLFDIEMEINTLSAANTDNISHTIDYAKVCQIVQNFVANTCFQLLEKLAEEVAGCLLKTFNIESCQITAYKQPFDLPTVKNVAVQIKRQNKIH